MNGENVPEMSLWQRLMGIITKPQDTLAEVIRKPTVLWPAVVISVVNLVFFLITMPKLQKYTLMALENLPQKIPPEQLARTKSIALIGVAVGGSLSVIIMPLVICLIITLLIKLFNLIIGSEPSFKQLYAVSLITSLPTVLGSILRTLLLAISPVESFATVTTSAALALPKGSTGPLFVVLSQVDPFLIWSLFLLSMGAAMVLKTSTKKTGFFFFIIWSLWTAVLVTMSVLFPQQPPAV